MEAFKIVKDAEVVSDSDGRAALPPALTEEQMREGMAKMFEELQTLYDNNPQEYNELIKACGLESGESIGSEGKSQTPMNSEKLASLAEAIKSMRDNDGKPVIPVHLPGGKGVLGAAGIEKQDKGKKITPIASFSVKTKRTTDSHKVFINMCTHEDIDEPAMKKKLNSEGESVEGLNIPMSVGQAHIEVDKSGASCSAFDVIVNPKVLIEATEDVTGSYRDFVCQLGIQSVEQKYKEFTPLDRRYKLPKLKYMGGATVPSQYIRDTKSVPKIEVVSESKSQAIKPTNKVPKPQDKVLEVDKPLTFRLAWLRCPRNNGSNNRSVDLAVLEESFNEKEDIVEFDASEYHEPMTIPDDDVTDLCFITEFSGIVSPKDVVTKISPFHIQVKIPSYIQASAYFPCAIQPAHTVSILRRPEGSVSRLELRIVMAIDRLQWDSQPDYGSKPWLIGKALTADSSSEGDSLNIYCDEDDQRAIGDVENKNMNRTTTGDDGDSLPEDRFHVNLPSNVDKYTGIKLDSASSNSNNDDAELPEDRFHRKDAASQFIINQREQALKDKLDKYEKEREERKNDPNIEYISMDDYKPGGKHGPPPEPSLPSGPGDSSEVREELEKAATFVATAAKASNIGSMLSSSMWTELLD